MADLTVFNPEINTVVESCDVTIDEIAPCPHDVFECAILMAWFEGEFVFYLVYLYPFVCLLHFLHIRPSYPYFTYYTSLYLVVYAYYYARMSRNEM
jgi:hypothetical protein